MLQVKDVTLEGGHGVDIWSWVWRHRPVIPALTVETKASLGGGHPGIHREILLQNKAAAITMSGKGI